MDMAGTVIICTTHHLALMKFLSDLHDRPARRFIPLGQRDAQSCRPDKKSRGRHSAVRSTVWSWLLPGSRTIAKGRLGKAQKSGPRRSINPSGQGQTARGITMADGITLTTVFFSRQSQNRMGLLIDRYPLDL